MGWLDGEILALADIPEPMPGTCKLYELPEFLEWERDEHPSTLFLTGVQGQSRLSPSMLHTNTLIKVAASLFMRSRLLPGSKPKESS